MRQNIIKFFRFIHLLPYVQLYCRYDYIALQYGPDFVPKPIERH